MIIYCKMPRIKKKRNLLTAAVDGFNLQLFTPECFFDNNLSIIEISFNRSSDSHRYTGERYFDIIFERFTHFKLDSGSTAAGPG